MASRKRTGRQRSKGQSLPLIALMIVVLVAMVGLSVDVGNTFQNERQAVSAANAASLSGMNAVIHKGNATRNLQVYNSIINSLAANGIQIAADGQAIDGQLRLDATYIDPQGKALGTISPDDSQIPTNVGYIQVNLSGIVNTYFAQVVGRPDLPINASAYAGQCSLGDGVYPIGIDQKYLGASGFIETPDTNGDKIPDDNWRIIQSGEYRGKTARRIFVKDDNVPGGFSFLRWKEDKGQTGRSATSAQELEASLTGFGNLSWGFDEAEEPLTGNQQATPGYPTQPGMINEGDWVWGTPGWKAGGQEEEILAHINGKTEMVLPLYDLTAGQGSNGAYHITGFGSFVIVGQNGKDDDLKGNGQKYFDFIYLGPATLQSVACNFSSVPVNADDCCELWGNVSVLPTYAVPPDDPQPIQYVVVLDQSGSMSANFNGQCNQDGSANPNPPDHTYYGQPKEFWQCANGPLYDTNNDGVGDKAETNRVTGTGQTYYWGTRDERRIVVAKKSLETLIKLTNMPGNSSYTTLYPDDQMALIWFTDTVDRDGNSNIEVFSNGKTFTNQRNELISELWSQSSRPDKNQYLTQGGTNGAAGLYKAFLALNSAPKEVVHTNGKTYKYKPVVLFITDGVSNQFFSPNVGNLRVTQSSSSTYPSGHTCRGLGEMVIEDAECQTTRYGGVYTTTVNGVNTGLDRPVTQAVNVSQDYLKKSSYSVFVIAMSEVEATGLSSGIPSFPHYYKSVPQLIVNPDGTTNMDTVVKEIQGIVDNRECQAAVDPTTTSTMTRDNFNPVQLDRGGTMTFPNVGIVTVRSTSSNASYWTYITVGDNGKLIYRFADKIPPGNYTMTATLYYKHPKDAPGVNNRAYDYFFDGTSALPSIPVEVTTQGPRNGSFLPSKQQDIQMRFRYDPCKV